ncbi:hypothetical protein [Peribacillus sp. SCS-155]|uniref:hypothetical protein n=1 Tax=Peribacillus sedimenti TaxID=3115297 RepID=UPI003905D7C0
MEAKKLKKLTAGLALATLIGSSAAPSLADAHWDSLKDEGKHHSQHKSWKHHYGKHHGNWQNKYKFLNGLKQGDVLGPVTVGSIVKGDTATTISLTGEVDVKGFYYPQTGQFSLNKSGFNPDSFNGFTRGKTILINNKSVINDLLQGHTDLSKLTGTLTNIQLVVSANGVTVTADLISPQPGAQ